MRKARLILLLLAVWLVLGGTAAAEGDVFTLSLDSLAADRLSDPTYQAEYLSSASQYLQVTCTLPQEAEVTLAITSQSTGAMVYQRNYGVCGGAFASDFIYLEGAGAQGAYTVTLQQGDMVVQAPYQHQLMYLTNNRAASAGISLKSLGNGLTDSWVTATLLDLEALNSGALTVPLCASNQYDIGTVTISRNGDSLSVSCALTDPNAIGITSQKLYLISNISLLTSLNDGALSGWAYSVGQDISLASNFAGVRYVLMYMPMRVDYDPNGLPAFWVDPAFMATQQQWLGGLLEQSANSAVG